MGQVKVSFLKSRLTCCIWLLPQPKKQQNTEWDSGFWRQCISHIAHGIFWFYHVLHHPEASGLIERWHSLLKTWFIAPPRWQYFAGLRQCSPGSCMCSKSAFNLRCYLSHSQDSRAQKSRGGSVLTPLLILVNFWHNFCCLCGLMLRWSRGLCSKGRNGDTPGDTKISLIWHQGCQRATLNQKELLYCWDD